MRVIAPNPFDRFVKNLKSVSYVESFMKIPILIYINLTEFTLLHAVS